MLDTTTTDNIDVPTTPTTPTTPPHYARWQALRDEAIWTTTMRAFAKKSNSAVFHFSCVADAPSWDRGAAFVEMRFSRDRRDGVEESLIVRFAGIIKGGYRDALRQVDSDDVGWSEYTHEDHNRYRPTSGAWVCWLFPSQHTHVDSCLAAIPSGANLLFQVSLDCHSSPILAECGLHGDALCVAVRKGKTSANYELAHVVTKHNSARFGE